MKRWSHGTKEVVVLGKCSNIRRDNEPDATLALTDSIAGGFIGNERIERMAVVGNLSAIWSSEDCQLPSYSIAAGRSSATTEHYWRPVGGAAAGTGTCSSCVRLVIVERHTFGIDKNIF